MHTYLVNIYKHTYTSMYMCIYIYNIYYYINIGHTYTYMYMYMCLYIHNIYYYINIGLCRVNIFLCFALTA